MKDRDAHKSVVPDRHRFDRVAVVELGNERNDTIFGEMREPNGLFPLENAFLGLDRHQFRPLEHGFALALREKAKDSIPDDGSDGSIPRFVERQPADFRGAIARSAT